VYAIELQVSLEMENNRKKRGLLRVEASSRKYIICFVLVLARSVLLVLTKDLATHHQPLSGKYSGG
jgi:hypothetical protein